MHLYVRYRCSLNDWEYTLFIPEQESWILAAGMYGMETDCSQSNYKGQKASHCKYP